MKNTAVDRVRHLLEELHADLVVTDAAGGVIAVRHGTAESVLRPMWAGQGFAGDVDRVLVDLAQNPAANGRTQVVVARRLADGSRRRLTEMGHAWVDEGGARIVTPQGLAVVVDRPVRTSRPVGEFTWTEARAAVAELLLDRASHGEIAPDGGELPTVASLADDLQLSLATVSRALRGFDGEGWTAKRGPERGSSSVRSFTDASAMLGAWGRWHASGRRAVVLAHRFIPDGDEFLRGLTTAWGDRWWALTGLRALDRRAPFTTNPATIDLYVGRAEFNRPSLMRDMLADAGLRVVDAGARVRLVEADEFLERLTPRAEVVPEVSDVRLFGDLLGDGVRGEDAAEHLRRERIGF